MNDEQLREIINEQSVLYDGTVVHLEKWKVTLPDGKPAVREVVLHRGAAAIVPVDDEGNTYLVRQFRAPLKRILLEIPAGKLDAANEDRLLAAKRELREETGFSAERWTHLVDLATTPEFCSEVISLYLARELTRGETEFDDDEFLDVVKMPFRQAAEMAARGEIEDGKTVSALLLAERAMRD